jgi:hypothetical protein
MIEELVPYNNHNSVDAPMTSSEKDWWQMLGSLIHPASLAFGYEILNLPSRADRAEADWLLMTDDRRATEDDLIYRT